MADMFELITYIGDKKYTCGTNFRATESENTWKPINPLEISENNDGKHGSTFKIYFYFQCSIIYDIQFGRTKETYYKGLSS